MNGLSWLLYGAEVADGLKNAAAVTLLGSAVLGVGAAIFGPIFLMDMDFDELKPALKTAFKTTCIVVPCALLVWIVAPSRQTIMLIAASEVGETVLASPEAQTIGGEAGALATDSLRVLRKFINEQLDAPASKETP